jgi:hypothetical protein
VMGDPADERRRRRGGPEVDGEEGTGISHPIMLPANGPLGPMASTKLGLAPR